MQWSAAGVPSKGRPVLVGRRDQERRAGNDKFIMHDGQSTLNGYPFREELLRRLKKSLVILTLCATMLALVMKANGERCWKSTWYSDYDNPNV